MEIDSSPYFGASITPRGNFLNDQYFEMARNTLQELMAQMQQNCNRHIQYPPGKVDYLLAELEAWQQSGQNMAAAMDSSRNSEVFTTVFRFEPDNLKVSTAVCLSDCFIFSSLGFFY